MAKKIHPRRVAANIAHDVIRAAERLRKWRDGEEGKAASFGRDPFYRLSTAPFSAAATFNVYGRAVQIIALQDGDDAVAACEEMAQWSVDQVMNIARRGTSRSTSAASNAAEAAQAEAFAELADLMGVSGSAWRSGPYEFTTDAEPAGEFEEEQITEALRITEQGI